MSEDATLPLLACPLCSHPPHDLRRPTLERGSRSQKFFLSAHPDCSHLKWWRYTEAQATPDPVVARWTQFVMTNLAPKAEQRGITPEAWLALLK